MAAEDKCIGKLYLDISRVKQDINEVNSFLGQIGANINLEDKLSKKIGDALKKLVDEAKKAGEEASKAIESSSSGTSKNNKELNEAIKLYEKLYKTVGKMRDMEVSGKSTSSTYARARVEAEQLYAQIQKLGDETRRQAEESERVQNAKKVYNAVELANIDKIIAKNDEAARKKAVADERAAAKAVAAHAKEEAAYNKIWQSAEKHQEKLQNAQKTALLKEEQKAVSDLVAKYQQYYQLESKKINAVNNGDLENADMYRSRAQAIWEEIAAIEAENPKLAEMAGATEQVTKAIREWQAVANAGQVKSDFNINKQEFENTAQALESLIQKYREYYNLESQKINAVHKGDIESADIFRARAQALWEEIAAIEKANPKLAEMAAESDKVNQAVQRWQMTAKQGELSAEQMFGIQGIANAKQKYFELTDAIKNYQAASKQGNHDEMAMWQTKISAIMQEVDAIRIVVEQSNLETGIKQQILNLIQQCTTAENQHRGAVAASAQESSKMLASTSEIQSQMTGLLTRMFSIMAVIRTINNLVNNTVEYVSQYYDKMNEIQIITQKSNEEVAQLGETYRDIAEMMNVSSLDMADAAIYFTRQGLGAEEIEKRLKNVTMYAKTANVEFKSASEIITAVVNSMGLVEQEAEDGRNATQRVADVFLKIGDNAATSGQEIGEAMQKAAASAGAFGVSMEWLASYIAAVSETTRQEARTIGTAFNTIIARLHQIKQNGYNSDDETKINDIAKALSKIDIVLMDQSGNWRDMEVILQEIAEKWGTLDGKTRSYIATTMAGVKQQNVFLALMNDMSKGIEGQSRAYELHELAINSAGTAQEKYATYMDSVAAAQNRLTVAQEKFYALLDASVIKGWYNMLAGIVDTISAGTETMGGLNIILPITIGLITTLIIAFSHLKAAAAEAGAASVASFMFDTHPIMLIISAVGALITILTALGDTLSQSKEKFEEASESVDQLNDSINSVRKTKADLSNMFNDLNGKVTLSKEDLEKYNGLLERVATISPVAKEVVDQLKNGFIDQGTAVKKLNEEIDNYIEKTQSMAALELIKKYNNYQSDTKNMQGYQNWDTSWFGGVSGKEGFTNALQQAYHTSYMYDVSPLSNHLMTEKYMSDDLYNQIYTWLEDGIPWDNIATYVWSSIFNGDASYDPEKAISNEVTSMIDDAMITVGQNMDSMDMSAVRMKLYGMLFGADGSLRVENVNKAAQVVSKFVSDAFENGFDPDKILTASERLSGFAGTLFGQISSEMYSEIVRLATDNPDAVDRISEAYTEMIGAGFSKADIASIFKNLSVDEWEDAIISAQDKVMNDIATKAGDHLNIDGDMMMWEELDLQTLKTISDMIDAGVALSDIKNAMRDSESVEEFAEKLKGLADAAGVDVPEGSEEAVASVEELAKEIKSVMSDIDAITKTIDAIKSGEPVKSKDLIDLATAHPEIMGFMDNADDLLRKLEEIKKFDQDKVYNDAKNMLLDNPDFLKNSTFSNFVTDDVQTLRQLMESIGEASGEYFELSNYVELATAQFLAFSDSLDKISPDKIKDIQTALFGNSNANLNNRPIVTGEALTAAGWGEDAGDYGTVYTSSYHAGSEGIKWHEDVIVSVTPILENGEVMSPESLDAYMDELFAKSGSMEELLVNDAKINGGKGLLIDVTAVSDQESFEEAEARVGRLMELLHRLQEMLYGKPEGAEKSWLQEQAEAAAEAANNEWAKSNGYVEQLTALQEEIDNNGVDAALELWNSYSEAIRKSIADEYPELIQALSDVEEELKADSSSAKTATEAHEALNNALRKSKTYANPKHFTSTYDAIRKLEKGTISAAAAFDTWHSELDTVKKADEDIIDVTQKMADGTEVTASDVSNLSKVLNMSAEQIIADWPTAVSMFTDLTGAGGELLDVFDALKEAAFIKITGTSEADFSQIKDGLISVQGLAEDVVNMLLATGEWSLEDVPLNTEAWVQGEDGSWNLEHLTGNMQVLRPSGNNPFQHGTGSGTSSSGSGRRRNGGGGGGSGSNSNQPSSDVTNLLDQMERIDKIHQYNMNYFNAQQQYYDTTGQLQGSIDAVRKEREELIAYQAVLESNIEAIQKMIAAKKKQLEATAQTDPAYQTLQNDLNSLNEALQQYTVDLYDNMTAQEEAAQAIEEYENKIRQMEIDIQNLIYQAILDREKKRKQMLAAEIEMENKVLDIIKQQYEEERDKILEATSARIEALQEERDLLSEQLQIRKEMEEKEEKAAKLAQLEAQYQRIVADPTRKKEAQKIKDQIDALRKEIAWDQAEDEVKAQQDSIDQQITSLEDYKQYIEEYYEDLFEHPQQLIAEMETIMSMSSDKILQWLQENDNEYLNSSENMQLQMTESWEDTLLEMEGKHRDYWDEVYSIMEQGDDAIIQFLQENSEDYANAGRLQAEAYVDEWKKMLEELRKAQEQVVADLPPVTELYPTGGGSGGSGGGGGGGGGHTPTQTVKHGYSFRFNGNTYANEGYATKAKAKEAGIQRFKQLYEAEARNYTAHPYGYDLSGSIYNATLNSIVAYKKGGLASATGPAWLDGTPQDPERVLSPYQTKLFETMVQALENIDRISMPSMPNLGNIQTGNSSNVSVGDIIVNVDNLDTDSDYEELAEKVSDVLMERIGRTAVVGGLRINAT